jgi:hypothetical protein
VQTYSGRDDTNSPKNIDASGKGTGLPFSDEGFILPEDLCYLMEPGIRYGKAYQCDHQIQWFIENGDESDFETLAVLAEHIRLQNDYTRFMQWWQKLARAIEQAVDKRFPPVITPRSLGVAKQRQEFYEQVLRETNNRFHHMDIFFLFGLIDACDMKFE